jgi:phosphate transport system substrate-binding protein
VAAIALVAAACSSTATTTTTTTKPAASSTTDTASSTPSIRLSEAGSSLLYPLFGAWANAYHEEHSNISVTTAATGSGAGITAANSGAINIGASDAYLPPATAAATPDLENIPLVISAQQVNYNIPGLSKSTHLKLSGTVLNDIYAGKISKWNNAQITKLNPGAKLPDLAIAPLHRGDSSGDTFLFTSYLNDSDPSGWVSSSGGPSESITFPNVTGAIAEQKNSGMLQGCKATPGCVAYIGISYLTKAENDGLGTAALENKSGAYEMPTSSAILAEASSFKTVPANGAISLIYGPAPSGYPIINFEYAIVLTKQSSSTTAKAIKSLLAWAMNPSDGASPSFLNPVHFEPLPVAARTVATKLINKIS